MASRLPARVLLLLTPLLAPLPAPFLAAAGGDLYLRNARVVDGTGGPPRLGVSILVRDGRIVAFDGVLEPPGVRVLDVGGATVLPGLIDTHVHFTRGPGATFRGDTADAARALNHQHLRAYLACGVTTVLDPGTPVEFVQDVQAWLAAGNPGPRYLTTGPMVQVVGGYPGGTHQGPIETAAEVEGKLDQIVALGGVGVKATTEQGMGGFRLYPPDMRAAIVEGARRRGLPIYVHATSERDDEVALDMHAHAIMHAPMGGPALGAVFGSDDLSLAFVGRMKHSGAYQLTTFSVLDTWPGHFDLARLDDPLVRLVVPEVELATARDPRAPDAFAVATIGFVAPWTFRVTRPWIGSWLWTRAQVDASLAYSQRQVLALYRAGVPIVAATDAPSPWPDAIYHFHGPQTAREVELVAQAGLPAVEALAAATRTPARMLGLEREIGTVEIGKRADLLIVDGDPLVDPTALRRVRWTVRDGEARTPAEWMAP